MNLNELQLQALDALQCGVIVCDLKRPDQPIVYANAGFSRLTGYRRTEALGKNCRFLQGDDSDPVTVTEIRQAIASGRETTVVIRNYRKDGSCFWNELRLVPITVGGEITHYTGIQTDVSARVEAERLHRQGENQMRQLLESTAEAIYGLDNDGNCTFCNPACVRMLGYDSSNELIGRNMHDLVHFRDVHGHLQPREQCLIYKAFKQGEETHSDNEVFWRRDGTSFPVEYRSHPIVSGDEVVGAVVNFFDISHRKSVEQALQRARRQADQANRSKTEFLANMSHEIRTPMTAILGYADILAAHLDNPDNRECVDVIKRNGRFLLNIVDDILDLSRIEAGQLRLENVQFRLDELITDIRSLMEVRAQEKGLPLMVENTGKIPALIETDPTRLRQILINLLSNAIKFTDEGAVRLVIDYQGVQHGNHSLLFEVIDTGIGVDPGQQQRIFKPFSQADASLTRPFEGTGLGLSISRRLAQMLGGEIRLESRLGQGSTFSLAVQAGAVAGAELVTPSHEISTPDGIAPIARRDLSGHVLVVDDRRDIRYLAAYFLEEAGARVATADNGRNALDLVESSADAGDPFDLILMDMQMPVLDGYAATRTLRQRGFNQPIVALTAGAMRKDRRKSIEAGCDAHVVKPIDGVALINLVAHYINDIDSAKLARQRDQRATIQPQSGNMENQTGHRILVVDDNLDAAEAIMKLLELLGHSVRAATSGAGALKTAAEFAPDFVILDLGLPDVDGYEVAARLRADAVTADATIVALSGREGDPDKLRESGFDHHFMKPADLLAIKSLISGATDGPGLSGRTS